MKCLIFAYDREAVGGTCDIKAQCDNLEEAESIIKEWNLNADYDYCEVLVLEENNTYLYSEKGYFVLWDENVIPSIGTE